jgi:hypothetical protein
MPLQKHNFATKVGALVLMLTPLAGTFVAPAETAATSPSPTGPTLAAALNLNLATTASKPMRDVMKIANSGVPEEVVKAYIQNPSITFNLTADNIIQLQGAGVSPSIITAMLNHDTALRQGASEPAPPPGQPALPPPDQIQGAATAQANPPTTAGYGEAGAYYNDLAPYGTWSYLPDYGYYWQPYGTFWAAYPGWGYPWWGWFDTGWWFCAGRGWCWFPCFHDRGFGRDHQHGFGFPGGRDHNFGTRGGFTASHGGHPFATSSGNRTIGNRQVTGNHGFGGTGSMGGPSRSQSVGRVPTVHQPMGGGFHGFSGSSGIGHSFSGSRGGGFGGGHRGGGGGHSGRH